jgi:anthranilate synthase component 1
MNLRKINPSPYMFFLDFPERSIVGSSPEILVRVQRKKVITRPIAGTRRRGRSKKDEKTMEKELLSDEKERAEHVMLVDLGRNDIGRVAELGSVGVTEFMKVEKYSDVQHLVSNVEGEMRRGMDSFDALRATFPAGTVTGAPKVRAMEIIEELEPTRRGIYAGAIGSFSYTGDADLAITIRTLVAQAGKGYIQVGAGIVADSVPWKEHYETENKARALLRAAGV